MRGMQSLLQYSVQQYILQQYSVQYHCSIFIYKSYMHPGKNTVGNSIHKLTINIELFINSY